MTKWCPRPWIHTHTHLRMANWLLILKSAYPDCFHLCTLSWKARADEKTRFNRLLLQYFVLTYIWHVNSFLAYSKPSSLSYPGKQDKKSWILFNRHPMQIIISCGRLAVYPYAFAGGGSQEAAGRRPANAFDFRIFAVIYDSRCHHHDRERVKKGREWESNVKRLLLFSFLHFPCAACVEGQLRKSTSFYSPSSSSSSSLHMCKSLSRSFFLSERVPRSESSDKTTISFFFFFLVSLFLSLPPTLGCMHAYTCPGAALNIQLNRGKKGDKMRPTEWEKGDK